MPLLKLQKSLSFHLLRVVNVLIMLSLKEQEQYHRHLQLHEIGVSGQEALKNAAVLVVGAGGLGCPVLQYLVAAGVGRIGCVDFDVVDLSNLQRQVLYGHSSIGKKKVWEAKVRLEDLNPFVQIEAMDIRITAENALSILDNYDIIVDCSDNYPTRYLLNDACVVLDKPMIYGAIYKFEGQVAVFNHQNGPNYRCLFPDPPAEESETNCSTTGVLGVLPGIIGTMQANEVVKWITGIGDVLSGKVWTFNALNNQTQIFQVTKTEHPMMDTLRNDRNLNPDNYAPRSSFPKTLNIQSVRNWREKQVLDVRNPDELPRLIGENVKLIPAPEIAERYTEIDSNRPIVVVCQTGKRSAAIVAFLNKEKGYENVTHCEQGVVGLLRRELNSTEV